MKKALTLMFDIGPWARDNMDSAGEGNFNQPWGLRVGLLFGQWLRPIPKFRFINKRPFVQWTNPWKGERVFLFRSFIPLPGMWLSFKMPGSRPGGAGFYIGTKLTGLDDQPGLESLYGNEVLIPSISIRKTADV